MKYIIVEGGKFCKSVFHRGAYSHSRSLLAGSKVMEKHTLLGKFKIMHLFSSLWQRIRLISISGSG